MTADFWTLLAETRPADGNPAVHASTLTERLAAGEPESVRAYGTAFDGAMDALYDWDLWGAAYLALGGCGDDSFEYLRAWIVGRGEEAWKKARAEPEAFFLELIGDGDDPEGRLLELGVEDGEALLYAGGIAHERLTGEWLPARATEHPENPRGEAWEEEELTDRFPDLAARVPEPDEDDWEGVEVPSAPPDPILDAIQLGLEAFSEGDHETAEKHLGPLVDDEASWARVHEALQVDVAYVVSAVRLQDGKVDEAAEALSRIRDRIAEVPPVRRALAQIELARGDLEAAGRWIEQEPGAARMDRALAAKLAWREGRREEAVRRATAELAEAVAGGEHPWDVAGALYQVGTVLAEAGDGEGAEAAVRAMATYLGDAPPELPLWTHLKLLTASVTRLQGRFEDALEQLDPLVETTGGTDRAEVLRERARALRSLGRDGEAREAYEEAIRGFDATGERWDAAATRREA